MIFLRVHIFHGKNIMESNYHHPSHKNKNWHMYNNLVFLVLEFYFPWHDWSTCFVSFETSVALVASECASLKIKIYLYKFYMRRRRPIQFILHTKPVFFYSLFCHSSFFCDFVKFYTHPTWTPVCLLFMGKKVCYFSS